jgi:hypothetical protein
MVLDPCTWILIFVLSSGVAAASMWPFATMKIVEISQGSLIESKSVDGLIVARTLLLPTAGSGARLRWLSGVSLRVVFWRGVEALPSNAAPLLLVHPSNPFLRPSQCVDRSNYANSIAAINTVSADP